MKGQFVSNAPAPADFDASRAASCSTTSPLVWTARLLDLLETGVLLALLSGQAAAWFLTPTRTIPRLGSGLLMISECVALVLFLSRRQATVRATSCGDWLVAWAAVGLPLLLRPSPRGASDGVAVFAVLALVAGFIVQLHAKCALGRNLGIVPALRTVCVCGPYRFVRHPMYAGYALSQLGFVTLYPTGANGVILALAWLLQWRRLRREELVLARDESYAEYLRRVPYRMIPGLL